MVGSSAAHRLRLLTASPPVHAVALSLVALVVHLPTLAQPLVEAHAFRQTQTAFAALIYHQNGIDLLNPTVPVEGLPWQVTFEFPVFQALAAILMDLGSPAEIALRSLSLACFVATGLLLWTVVRRIGGNGAALVALAAFLLSPFGLLWSRTSLIEFPATACALGFVSMALTWRERRSHAAFALAIAAGSLAMLIKPTTAVYWILPFLVLGFERDPNPLRLRRLLNPAALALVAIPVAVGFGWTWYVDGVKAAFPGTAHLTSSAMFAWNFGTIPQRLDAASWLTVGYRLLLMGGWLLPVAIPLAFVRARRQRHSFFLVWMIAAASLPIATFTNLYVVHDYYLAAINPAIAGLIGLGLGGWLSQLTPRRAAAAALEGTVLWTVALLLFGSYWLPMYEPVSDPEYILPRAQQIRDRTQPGDLVAVNISAWNPALFYYAGRWGTAIGEDLAAPPGYVAFRCTPAGDPQARCTRQRGAMP